MNCGDLEQLIALYVEGDLSAAERSIVETHLLQCGDCRELASDLRESQTIFKSIREEMPSSSDLLELRHRVLNDVGPFDPPGWVGRWFAGMRRKVAFAGFALMIAGGAWWFTRVTPPIADKPTLFARNPAPAFVDPAMLPETQPRPVPPVRRSKPPAPAKSQEIQQQVTIKLLTDDPNIIIYWLVDEKGD